MEPVATKNATRAIVERHNFQIKKGLGQNFLTDSHVLNKIIEAAEITKDDLVIEIGPGIGALTQPACRLAGKVVAIEIDKALIPVLKDTLDGFDNVEVINADILSFDIRPIIEKSGCSGVKVVANLPYYITTPIIMGLLESHYPIDSLTVMVQKEVAMRLKAKPSTKDYGALSLAAQYYSEPYLAANVPSNCFFPRPNVDSAVIRLKVYKEQPVITKDVGLMFNIIRLAFSKRRKTLVNCLYGTELTSMSKDALESLLQDCGFDPMVRGESLNLNDYAKIADCFYTANQNLGRNE